MFVVADVGSNRPGEGSVRFVRALYRRLKPSGKGHHTGGGSGLHMDSSSVPLLDDVYRLRRTDLLKVLAEGEPDFVGRDPGSAASQKEGDLILDSLVEYP